MAVMHSKDPTLQSVSEQTAQRYGERYSRMGKDVRSLGWGSDSDQEVRFSQVLRLMPAPCSSVLDIGCGFGDFLSFMVSHDVAPGKYIGWDITPSFVDEATRIHHLNPAANFELRNLLDVPMVEPVADCAVMLGLLNFNWKGQVDNLEYSKRMIRRAFALARDVLIVDFLSVSKSPDYPAEAGVFYHDPAQMLNFALSLTPSIALLQDYPSIPQREFMLALRHSP